MVDFAPLMLISQGTLTPIVAMVPDNIVFLEDPTMSLYPSPVQRKLPNI